MTKSPFYVVEEFLSPLLCEQIIDICDFIVPNKDKNDKEILTTLTNEQVEAIVYDRLLPLIPQLEKYYNIEYKGTEPVQIEWYPQDAQGEFSCENSSRLRGKWIRTKQRDLTAILFLSDYQDKLPFEAEFEVYGGRLEFVQHAFSFNPQRGTLVVFPSDPHFINVTSKCLVGDAFQCRIQLAAKTPFLYNPEEFPGNYTTWFSDKI